LPDVVVVVTDVVVVFLSSLFLNINMNMLALSRCFLGTTGLGGTTPTRDSRRAGSLSGQATTGPWLSQQKELRELEQVEEALEII
jgi:hypothetical protein